MIDGYYQRQAGMLPPDTLDKLPIAVAGVGAVGRQVVLQLASAGARNIQMFDHDEVEDVNIGPQGWSPNDVGMDKVYALSKELAHKYDETIDFCIQPRKCRFPADTPTPVPKVLFCCVDGIETRNRIFCNHRDSFELFLDSRVAADVIHILACCEKEHLDYYPTTMFSEGDAFRGSCTTKMSIHMANIAAGLLIQQLSKWLRQLPIDRHVMFNLLSMEAFCK
jgi:hypothetical protein